MKTRLIIITGFLLSIFLLGGCGSEKAPEDLKTDVKEIQKLEKQSEDLSSADEAFSLLRNLNQAMKSVRDKILELDKKYRNASEAEKKKMVDNFTEINKEIDKSLKVIRKNIKPYEDDEQVSNMIDKLEGMLISK
ncbi:MAG: hypothetical protein K9I68_05030 [Bacteroidales bacterium]|nr:hypothetical protein [Bacteroidales bacterium]MCF8337015.1 hypothetical protein [Bacteroidales bacterium]